MRCLDGRDRGPGATKTLVALRLEKRNLGVNVEHFRRNISEIQHLIKQGKAGGIVNDPNQWSEDPRYIVELIKRVVRVSMETVEIVAGLPRVFAAETTEDISSGVRHEE